MELSCSNSNLLFVGEGGGMRSKKLKVLVFFTCGLTLLGGAYSIYHFIFRADPSSFSAGIYKDSLSTESMSSMKKGSLLSRSPFVSEVTDQAENRVRARSPAFQKEATLDERRIEQLRQLVRAQKLGREDEMMKRYIPDDAGVGF